jgi:hypothetical protein
MGDPDWKMPRKILTQIRNHLFLLDNEARIELEGADPLNVNPVQRLVGAP